MDYILAEGKENVLGTDSGVQDFPQDWDIPYSPAFQTVWDPGDRMHHLGEWLPSYLHPLSQEHTHWACPYSGMDSLGDFLFQVVDEQENLAHFPEENLFLCLNFGFVWHWDYPCQKSLVS